MPDYQARRTRHGWRLLQHGAVLSELRSTPGPTHSVFDILAVLMAMRGAGGDRMGLMEYHEQGAN